VFDALSERLDKAFTKLRSKGRLSESDLDATAREIRIALLEADVALPVVREFIAGVKDRARGIEVSKALNPAQQVIKIIHEELIGILGGQTRRVKLAKVPPTVIMLAGLQGAGKTTLAGKLGLWLREQGHTPLLVAADLQRPNAVQQLQIVGEQAGVAVFAPEPGSGVGDPVDVAKRSMVEGGRTLHDIIVVDTAGRLGVDAEMMSQAAAIRDAVHPDETLFVVDAMIGQDAVTTAEAFRAGVGFTGVVLTKLDGDARGGAALSVRYITGQPILFASTGEKLADFDVFHPERIASRILGMGDMLTLIEHAERTFDKESAERAAAKLTGGGDDFTLEDFLEQMLAVQRMGPIGNLLGMLPGMGQVKEQLDQVDDRDLDRIAAVIRSMTPAERHDPKIINGSRRARIAAGSGSAISDVNQLVDRFFEARKMMKQMAGGMGMPGMPGRRKATKSPKNKRKGKQSGGRFPAGGRQPAPGGGAVSGASPEPGSGAGGMAGLPPGFRMPNIDLSELQRPPPDS